MGVENSILLVITLAPVITLALVFLKMRITDHLKALKTTTEWFENELGATIHSRPGLFGPNLSASAVVDGTPVEIEQINQRQGRDRFEAIRFKAPHEFDFQTVVIEKKPSLFTPFIYNHGRKSGNTDIDSRFVMAGSQESLTRFCEDPNRTRSLKRMLRLGLSKLLVTPQEMIAYSRYFGQRPERYEKLIKELTRLATGHQIAMSVENKVSTDTQQTQTCPFCRDSLEVDLEPTTHCDHCHTAHHEECFEEAGGCTVYACGPQKTAHTCRG